MSTRLIVLPWRDVTPTSPFQIGIDWFVAEDATAAEIRSIAIESAWAPMLKVWADTRANPRLLALQRAWLEEKDMDEEQYILFTDEDADPADSRAHEVEPLFTRAVYEREVVAALAERPLMLHTYQVGDVLGEDDPLCPDGPWESLGLGFRGVAVGTTVTTSLEAKLLTRIRTMLFTEDERRRRGNHG